MYQHQQSMWQGKPLISNFGKSGNLRMQTRLCQYPGHTDSENYSRESQLTEFLCF